MDTEWVELSFVLRGYIVKSSPPKNKKQVPQSTTNIEQTDEGANSQREEYIDARKGFIDLQHQVSQSLDKTVITLAGGALALSITFIQQIAPHPEHAVLPFLAWSWALLVFALLTILVSLFTSQVGMTRMLEELDNEYNSSDVLSPPKNPILRFCNGCGVMFNRLLGWRPLTSIFNFVAILSTIAGIALLAWFSIQNIYHIR